MSDVFKALSDPTRRKILQMLRNQDLPAGEIAEPFAMSKPAISKHLDILRNADLITSEKQGQFVRYSLNTSALQNTLGAFLEFFDNVKEASVNEKEKI